MGRNNEDFESDRYPKYSPRMLPNGHPAPALGEGMEEVDENAFNKSYETWKKAGDPFRKKEKNKND